MAPAEGAPPQDVSLASGETVEGVDFVPNLGTITGRVVNALDESPWFRASVCAVDDEGTTRGRVATGGNGNYRLWLPPGTYQVSVLDATGADPGEVTLDADERVEGIDLAATPALPFRPGPSVPPWLPITVLAVVGLGILAGLIPLVRRRRRLGGVLLSPSGTFAEVAERPDWVGPFFVVLVSALLISLAAIGKIFTAMASSPGGMRGSMEIIVVTVGALSAVVGLVVFGYAAWLARAGLIWLFARISGARTGFYPLVSAVGYACVPALLLNGVAMAFMIAFGSVRDPGPWSAMVTSLAALVPELARSNPPLHALLGQVELFSLWSLVLTMVAVRAVYRFSTRKAAVISVLYWLLAAGVTVGFVALVTFVKGLMGGGT